MEKENSKVNLLDKEIELKDVEINSIKESNKYKHSYERLKMLAIAILIAVEVFVAYHILESYNLIPSSNETVLQEDKVHVVTVRLDKQITTTYINTLIDKMDKIKNDKNIEEILLIINSPGGSPSASEEFSEYLKMYNDKYIHINVYVEEIAASGAYYIASSIKPLQANPNAIIGSIGVIMPKYNIKDLADKIGVQEDNIVAGKYKVPASLFEPVTKEQKKYLSNNLLTPTYQNFLKAVATNRELNISTIEPFAEGQIFLASMSKIQGTLIDKTTNMTVLKSELIEKIKNKTKVNEKDILFTPLMEEKKKNPLFSIGIEGLELLTQILNNNIKIK